MTKVARPQQVLLLSWPKGSFWHLFGACCGIACHSSVWLAPHSPRGPQAKLWPLISSQLSVWPQTVGQLEWLCSSLATELWNLVLNSGKQRALRVSSWLAQGEGAERKRERDGWMTRFTRAINRTSQWHHYRSFPRP